VSHRHAVELGKQASDHIFYFYLLYFVDTYQSDIPVFVCILVLEIHIFNNNLHTPSPIKFDTV
jgi:hypothetical protein